MSILRNLLCMLPMAMAIPLMERAAPLNLTFYESVNCSTGLIYPTPSYGITNAVFTVCATIEIKGTATQASNAILDFVNYSKWNKFVYFAGVPAGTVTPGGVEPGLPVLFNSTGIPPGSNASSTDVVSYVDRPYFTAWTNTELIPYTGYSEHVQVFVPLPGGKVRYINYQTQYGPGAENIAYLQPDFQTEFEVQAEDLKAYVESM